MDRDPRWGRTDEAFGEDPYLVGQMSGAFVDGYQGETMSGKPMTPYLKVAATAKHFALNNDENNRHAGSSNTTDANIRDYYTKQFQSLVENAHVVRHHDLLQRDQRHAVAGRHLHGQRAAAAHLRVRRLHHLGLRRGRRRLQRRQPRLGAARLDHSTVNGDHLDQHRHRAAASAGAAGGQAYALRAGTQLNCTGGEPTLTNIQDAINAGVLSEGVIDNDLVQLFTMRMETGEFDPPSKVAYTRITKA